MSFIGWFIKLSVQTFEPLIIIYRRGNFGGMGSEDVHQFIGHCPIPLAFWGLPKWAEGRIIWNILICCLNRRKLERHNVKIFDDENKHSTVQEEKQNETYFHRIQENSNFSQEQTFSYEQELSDLCHWIYE